MIVENYCYCYFSYYSCKSWLPVYSEIELLFLKADYGHMMKP